MLLLSFKKKKKTKVSQDSRLPENLKIEDLKNPLKCQRIRPNTPSESQKPYRT